MRRQPHVFLTLGRDVVNKIRKEIKNDIPDQIFLIQKYLDKSSSEGKYCVAKHNSKIKTEILIEKDHEIDLQWIKKLTHGYGNGFF